MRSKNRNEFWFAVGKPTERRSTVWKVISTKDDIYILSRMMGSVSRISLHQSGDCQWSLTSDWIGKNGH